MIYQESMSSKVLLKFMNRLIMNANRKILLILGNLRVHHSRPVKEWLAKHVEEIEVFYLPAYSPEVNPDEYLNCDLKAGVHSKPPARVAKYFKHSKIAYAL